MLTFTANCMVLVIKMILIDEVLLLRFLRNLLETWQIENA